MVTIDQYKLIVMFLILNLGIGLLGAVIEGDTLNTYLENDKYLNAFVTQAESDIELGEADYQTQQGEGVQEPTGEYSILTMLGSAVGIFWMIVAGIPQTFYMLLQNTGNTLFNLVGVLTALALFTMEMFLLMKMVSYIRKGDS